MFAHSMSFCRPFCPFSPLSIGMQCGSCLWICCTGVLQFNNFHNLRTMLMKLAVSFQEAVLNADVCKAATVLSQKTFNTRETFCFSILDGHTVALVNFDNLTSLVASILHSSFKSLHLANFHSWFWVPLEGNLRV